MLNQTSYRWLWAVAIVALLVSAVLLTAAPTSATGPYTFVVDDDGLATTTDCNSGAAADSSTISGAIALAGTGGDRVLVCPGNYAENVVVDKANLTLRGIGGTQPVVDAGGDGSAITIAASADGVTIDNFKAVGGGLIGGGGIVDSDAGIHVKSDNNIITGNTATLNSRAGIWLAGDGAGGGRTGISSKVTASSIMASVE